MQISCQDRPPWTGLMYHCSCDGRSILGAFLSCKPGNGEGNDVLGPMRQQHIRSKYSVFGVPIGGEQATNLFPNSH